MRIATHAVSENIIRQIEQIGSQQARLQQQVATGQRIFLPEDDPAAVRRALNLGSEQRELAQFVHNAGYALEVSQASSAGLQQLKRISDRATEIGTLGSGTLDPSAARAYAAEVDQLVEQALQVANAKFRGEHLHAGTAVDAAPFAPERDAAGRIMTIAYAGNGGRAAIRLSPDGEIVPRTGEATNHGIRDFLGQLVALRDGLESAAPAAVAAAQQGLLASEDRLITALADQGGLQLRIEIAQGQQQDRAALLEQQLSRETDADLPSTIVKLNQAQTAYQAALQSAANIMRLSLLDYLR